MNPKAEEILIRMTDREWERIVLQLARYAKRKSRMYFYRGGYDLLPNGDSLESLVHTAILKLYSGERDWDPDKRPDLLIHLKGVVKSLLWHSVKSFDNRALVPEPPEPDDEDGRGWAAREKYELAAWQSSDAATPCGILLDDERRTIGARALEVLLIECKDDQVLLGMIELMKEGITKPAILASKLGLQTKEIYVAIKRLERKFITTTERMKEELAIRSFT
jgi:hypothetical protein